MAENENAGKKKFWKGYTPTEKFNFVLVVFTIIYSIITGGLLINSRDQLDGMKKDERPWLRVQTQVQIPNEGTGTAVSIPAFVLNTGKTPAKAVDVRFYVEEVKNGEEPKLNKSVQVAMMTTGIIFPNETNPPFVLQYTFLKSSFDDFKDMRTFLVVYTHAEYRDIFGINHWTASCQFATFPGKLGNFTAKKCTDYNNTDDN